MIKSTKLAKEQSVVEKKKKRKTKTITRQDDKYDQVVSLPAC